MTASEQIMAVMATRGQAKVADICAVVEASQGAVYQALSTLAAAGELVRIAPGVYAMNADSTPQLTIGPITEPAEAKRPRKKRAAPPPGSRCRGQRRPGAARPVGDRFRSDGARGVAHRRGDRAPR